MGGWWETYSTFRVAPSSIIAWYVSPIIGFKGLHHLWQWWINEKEDTITYFILFIGSLVNAAAFRNGVIGPPTDPYT